MWKGRRPRRWIRSPNGGSTGPAPSCSPRRDDNGDGRLDLIVRSSPGAQDANPILNAIWIFPSGNGPAAGADRGRSGESVCQPLRRCRRRQRSVDSAAGQIAVSGGPAGGWVTAICLPRRLAWSLRTVPLQSAWIRIRCVALPETCGAIGHSNRGNSRSRGRIPGSMIGSGCQFQAACGWVSRGRSTPDTVRLTARATPDSQTLHRRFSPCCRLSIWCHLVFCSRQSYCRVRPAGPAGDGRSSRGSQEDSQKTEEEARTCTGLLIQSGRAGSAGGR